MKKLGYAAAFLIAAGLLVTPSMDVSAKNDQDTIYQGIYIGDIDVSGMTQEEAKKVLDDYIASLEDKEVVFKVGNEAEVTFTAKDLGLTWENPGIVESAAQLGKTGTVLERYKLIKDLEYDGHGFDMDLSFDDEVLIKVLEEECQIYDVEAKNATIHREEETFVVTEGSEGHVLNLEESKQLIQNSLKAGWDDASMQNLELVVEVSKPKATAEDLKQIKDCLGSFTTSYTTSGSGRSANVANGCNHIDGSIIMPGEEYSVYDAVKPFSEANGYYMAGSYLNGQVVDSIGGGICQVSTTLYNAVLRAELEVTMRYNHSMIVSYVDPSADAAIAESSGKDFKFVNNTDYPIYIEGFCENKHITMNIYGVETRPANRVVTYESKELSRMVPDMEIINQNAGWPVGNITISSAHIGVKAELWKVVTVDGVEQSREKVNSSNYAASPRSCTVGTATSNEGDYNNLMAAIATGSIDQVAAVSNAIKARDEAAAAAAAQQQAWQQQWEQAWQNQQNQDGE